MTKWGEDYWRCHQDIYDGFQASVECGGLCHLHEREAHARDVHGRAFDAALWSLVPEAEKVQHRGRGGAGARHCDCGAPKEPKQLSCAKCRRLERSEGTLRRLALEAGEFPLADSLCAKCGKRYASEGFKKCDTCRDINGAATQKYREREKQEKQDA